MWIVSNKGFMSIVAKGRDGKASPKGLSAVVSVRFRRPKDAEALFPGHTVVLTPNGDYACRVFATRAEVAEVLFKEAVGLDYTNFKSSIPLADAALSRAAHKAWDVFGDLQEGGPYGRDVPRQRVSYDYPAAYTGDLWDDPVWRLPAGPKKAKAKGVNLRKPKRHDPFCEGCGMRFGVKNLDDDGHCVECAEALAAPQARTDDPAWRLPVEDDAE